MLGLLKVLKKGDKKKDSTLPPLVLSEALCTTLGTLSQIFGQTWHLPVLAELLSTPRSPAPPSGQSLAMILTKLVEEAAVNRPGLSARFVITRNQIVYRSADRRYTVLVVQGDEDPNSVRVVWQVAHRQYGTSYIAYVVRGKVWQPVDWKVSQACLSNLDHLAKVGGEVLGFLDEFKLLPPGSPFQRALEAQVSSSAMMKEEIGSR